MSQRNKAINYMLNHGSLTRQIAFMSLDIANLTAVISDVRDALGYRAVITQEKVDPKGRTYASYTLHPNIKDLLMNRGAYHGGRAHV